MKSSLAKVSSILAATLLISSCGNMALSGKSDSSTGLPSGYDSVGTSTNETANLLEMVKQDFISFGVKESSLDFSKIGVVGVGSLDDNTVGICISGTKNIVLNRKKFESGALDIYDKKGTLAHEIGHCLFNLQHDDSHLAIMNTKRVLLSNTMYHDLMSDLSKDLIAKGY